MTRIRGKVGKGANDKFYFELSFWSFDGETMQGNPLTVGLFETEAVAFSEMREAVRLALDTMADGMGVERTNKFIDMKNGGVLRNFDEN